MLLCTHFQVCFDQVLDKSSPIQKVNRFHVNERVCHRLSLSCQDEMRLFITNQFCDKLGSFKDAVSKIL
jgi:hypothetical protein